MRIGSVGALSILAILLLLTGNLAVLAQPPVKVQVQDETDLHAMCDKVARDCWDLDPAAFGMHPVLTALPPIPSGTLLHLEGNEHVKFSLGGGGPKAHVLLKWDESVSRSSNDYPEPKVPCSDPRGCPDLHVDAYTMLTSPQMDVRTFSEDSCAVRENSTVAGERQLLRFSFRTPNVGSGDLIIGDPDDHPEWFQWGDCHEHWHFREYADYRLWDAEGYAVWKAIRLAYPHLLAGEILEDFPELKDHFRAGHKQGFCVIDIRGWYYTAGPRNYRSCSSNQGITVTWADEYGLWLDGQWVDVTDLEPGAYYLEAEVNPERFYGEESYTNNDMAVLVQLE